MKPTLTADFLAQYDVIILQWMVADGIQYNDGAPWVFSSDEVSALQTWVTNGGGVIALNGYQGTTTIVDVTATNQLLSFTDMQFDTDDVLDPMGPAGCGSDCYCWGGPVTLGSPLPGTTTAQAISVGTWNQSGPIGKNVSDLGAYVARSITVKNAANVVVDESDSTHTYVAHEAIGKGHVLFYGDEWITYSGEWTGMSRCLNFPYDSGYDPCYQKSPAQVFQIPQFWYNSIKFASSAVQCFTIHSPGIVY